MLFRSDYVFQTTTLYNTSSQPNSYYIPNFKYPDYLIVFSGDTNINARVISPNGLTNEFTLPTPNNNSYNLYTGRDKFLYVYNRLSDNNVIIELYDLDFNLLTSYDTGYQNWWDIEAIKDRFIVTIIDNSTWVNYLVTPTGVTPINTLTKIGRAHV